MSPKGGAGKTTVATNLATRLALSAPGRVAIVDLDLQFGDVASALGLGPQATIADAARLGNQLDSTALKVFLEPHPSGLYALVGPHFPAEAEEVSAVGRGRHDRHPRRGVRLHRHRHRRRPRRVRPGRRRARRRPGARVRHRRAQRPGPSQGVGRHRPPRHDQGPPPPGPEPLRRQGRPVGRRRRGHDRRAQWRRRSRRRGPSRSVSTRVRRSCNPIRAPPPARPCPASPATSSTRRRRRRPNGVGCFPERTPSEAQPAPEAGGRRPARRAASRPDRARTAEAGAGAGDPDSVTCAEVRRRRRPRATPSPPSSSGPRSPCSPAWAGGCSGPT